MRLIKQVVKKCLLKLLPECSLRIRSGINEGKYFFGHPLETYRQYILGNKEDKLQAVLQGIKLEGKTVYEIGSHYGFFSIYFAEKVGDKGAVFSFEPNPANCKILQINLLLNDIENVKVLNYGIGANDGTALMFIDPLSSQGGSINPLIKECLQKQGQIITTNVNIYSIDSLLIKKQLSPPDFAKIDVEGEEYHVLVGMQDVIEKYHPELVIEIHGIGIDDKKENVRKIVNMLIDHAYKIFHIETSQVINKANAEIAREGLLFCTYRNDE